MVFDLINRLVCFSQLRLDKSTFLDGSGLNERLRDQVAFSTQFHLLNKVIGIHADYNLQLSRPRVLFQDSVEGTLELLSLL